MTPLRNYLIVKRKNIAPTSVLILPNENLADALVGDVLAVGEGVMYKKKLRPLDVKERQQVIYSSRIDTYRTKDGDFDVIDEASVIGFV